MVGTTVGGDEMNKLFIIMILLFCVMGCGNKKIEEQQTMEYIPVL